MNNLADREFSITYSLAAGFWILAAFVIALNWFVPIDLLGVAFWTTGIACCLTVRGYLCRMIYRERRAFEAGVDVGLAKAAQQEENVRSLR